MIYSAIQPHAPCEIMVSHPTASPSHPAHPTRRLQYVAHTTEANWLFDVYTWYDERSHPWALFPSSPPPSLYHHHHYHLHPPLSPFSSFSSCPEDPTGFIICGYRWWSLMPRLD